MVMLIYALIWIFLFYLISNIGRVGLILEFQKCQITVQDM